MEDMALTLEYRARVEMCAWEAWLGSPVDRRMYMRKAYKAHGHAESSPPPRRPHGAEAALHPPRRGWQPLGRRPAEGRDAAPRQPPAAGAGAFAGRAAPAPVHARHEAHRGRRALLRAR